MNNDSIPSAPESNFDDGVIVNYPVRDRRMLDAIWTCINTVPFVDDMQSKFIAHDIEIRIRRIRPTYSERFIKYIFNK